MLRRLKTVPRKYRFAAGLWIAVELLAIPAAATVALSTGMSGGPEIVAERVNQDQPGTAIYVVTHSEAFSVAVSGTNGAVLVDSQGTTEPLGQARRTSQCSRVEAAQMRIVGAVEAPEEGFGITIVTVTYDPDTNPDLLIGAKIMAPVGESCSATSA
ncbi:MAG: hypothetical protein WBF53_17075 [Litorimonas sp.]